jgi:hypothetical protein
MAVAEVKFGAVGVLKVRAIIRANCAGMLRLQCQDRGSGKASEEVSRLTSKDEG